MGIQTPNYTQIPNEFLDKWVKELSGSSVKVFLSICRNTLGWHERRSRMADSRLMQATGIKSKETLYEAVKELIEKELVIKEVSGSGMSAKTYYEIQWDGKRPNESNGTESVPENGTETVPMNGTETVHNERKEIKEKDKETSVAKATNPFLHDLVTHYKLQYTLWAGQEPYTNGIIYKNMKDLLRSQKPETIKKVIDTYFSRDWFFSKDGRDFGQIMYNFNKILSCEVKGCLEKPESEFEKTQREYREFKEKQRSGYVAS